ncbi:hypothetical protein EW145_g6661 [Phellinidium pouzarii]|uniref:Protein kinase domain-containing protein n=1 Tax=Phellinidium pouzarii TaxID=167371 RepID=A0A4S4KVW0_9AGAM|nr:hypothetical protein EW145_g6661 [Phellinidium pouzarii]
MSTTTSSKRPAPRTPEGRPPKRRATSSPEEGEVDDANVTGGSGAGASRSTPTSSINGVGNNKFRVPFPFKNKICASTKTMESLRDGRDRSRDRDRDADRGRDREWSSRPPVVYERSEDDERRFREEESAHRTDRYARNTVGNRWKGSGDHYEPSASVAGKEPYHATRDRGWERDWEWERDKRRNRSQDSRLYSSPRRDVAPPVRSPSKSRSPSASRGPSPPSRSLSPQSRRERQKHRLPTPRSTTIVVSPKYDRERDYDLDHDREREWDRGERYEPYGREYYRDRDHDPRGQYYREETDDWDRYYRPAGIPLDQDRGRPHYSLSPVYHSTTPPRRTYDVTRAPERTVPSIPTFPPPPPPPPQLEAISEREPSIEPPVPESLRPHEAVSFELRRPGAPRKTRSPPSVRLSSQKPTPAPAKPPIPFSAETPASTLIPSIIAKKKRMPVKRTREEEKSAYRRVFVGCGRRDDYDIMTKLGEGTFGEVHKALHRETREPVALKRILMHNEKEGMPVTALREIKILKALRHPCIVDLLDMFVVPSKGKDMPMSVYMVFPYMDHDLAGLLENERVKLTPSQIKLYMKQLLEGTEYMHHNNILHRDMKAANLLIANSGALKIADFGLARAFDPIPAREGRGRYTNCVVTRWYRPPELLLGARQYGGEIDIWGIGCVLGEMFMRRPILPGNSDLDQLDKIWAICGSPNQQNWPDYDKLPGCEGQIRFKPQERRIKSVYESLGKETCALLDRLLTLDPRERISASQALDHEYFWSDPLAADPKSLMSACRRTNRRTSSINAGDATYKSCPLRQSCPDLPRSTTITDHPIMACLRLCITEVHTAFVTNIIKTNIKILFLNLCTIKTFEVAGHRRIHHMVS